MSTVIEVKQTMLIHDEKSGKTMELSATDLEVKMSIEMYPVLGGEDWLAMELTETDIDNLIKWLKGLWGN